MRKSRDKALRHVYFYACKGVCGRRRATFDHERALASVCTKCEPQLISPDQSGLFGYAGTQPTNDSEPIRFIDHPDMRHTL